MSKEYSFIYEILGFGAPAEIGKMGGYGFNILLDPEIAKKAIRKEMTKNYYNYAQTIGKKMIIATGLEKKRYYKTIYFCYK